MTCINLWTNRMVCCWTASLFWKEANEMMDDKLCKGVKLCYVFSFNINDWVTSLSVAWGKMTHKGNRWPFCVFIFLYSFCAVSFDFFPHDFTAQRPYGFCVCVHSFSKWLILFVLITQMMWRLRYVRELETHRKRCTFEHLFIWRNRWDIDVQCLIISELWIRLKSPQVGYSHTVSDSQKPQLNAPHSLCRFTMYMNMWYNL